MFSLSMVCGDKIFMGLTKLSLCLSHHKLKVLLRWPLTLITGGCCLKVRRYIPLAV